MKQKLIWVILALATAVQATTLDTGASFPQALKPVLQEAQAAHLAADLLSRGHYKPIPLDDALSTKIFDKYLKSLDPEKLYFLQTDIDRLGVDRTLLDDAIRNEDLSVPFEIYNLYIHRAAQHLAYARTLLQKGFDFQRDESYQIDRKNQPWPATEEKYRTFGANASKTTGCDSNWRARMTRASSEFSTSVMTMPENV